MIGAKLSVVEGDRGCLLAVQGEGMIGEDYQVYISDGPALGQVLVLGCGDPTAGGKQKTITFKNPISCSVPLPYQNLYHCYRNI